MAEATSPRSHKKAKQGLEPKFRKRFNGLPRQGPTNAIAVQGLEPNDRNRFGMLPDLSQLSLPSSLSRRSAQLKATTYSVGATHLFSQCHPPTA